MQAPGSTGTAISLQLFMARINQPNSSSMNIDEKIESISSSPTLIQRKAVNPCIDAPTFFDIALNIH